jgi:hypothetical protein
MLVTATEIAATTPTTKATTVGPVETTCTSHPAEEP